MIKQGILTASLLFMAILANAQKLSYGFKIGGGLAEQQVKGTDVLGTDNIQTFNVSVFGQIPLKHEFWLRAGLGFAGKGGVVYNDALTTTSQLGYLELPVIVLKKFDYTSLGRFYLGAGGYFATGMRGTVEYETPGSKTEDKLTFGADNDVKTNDIGLSFLAGFEFNNKLMFNVGYSLGMNNIASTAQLNTGTSVVKNRVFSLGLGYLIK